MSELKGRLAEETKEAMKSRDETRLSALRLLSDSIAKREKDLRRELEEEEVREIASREAKKRREAIEAYKKGRRSDLVDRERGQLDAIASYLPEQLSDEQIEALVEEAVSATGAASMSDMGKVMGAVMAKAKGKADGSAVKESVARRLGG